MFVEAVFVEAVFVDAVFVEAVFEEAVFVEAVFVEAVFVAVVFAVDGRDELVDTSLRVVLGETSIPSEDGFEIRDGSTGKSGSNAVSLTSSIRFLGAIWCLAG